MTTELQPVTCSSCGSQFAVEIPAEGEPYREMMLRMAMSGPVECTDCEKKHVQEITAAKILAAESAKQTSWQTFCPNEFRKEINWQIKSANRTNYTKVMAWYYGPRGLLVMGPPGSCKTRFVWKLLKCEWDAGRTIRALGHTKFRIDASALAAADSARFKVWVDDLCKAQIFFLDDLGKGRATPLSEECLHGILEVRTQRNLPTLFTSNYVIEKKDSYEDGLERRIIEFVEPIQF